MEFTFFGNWKGLLYVVFPADAWDTPDSPEQSAWSPTLGSTSDSSFLLILVQPGWQQVEAPGLGSLPSTWETWKEFWAPGFDLAQPWLL